MLPVTSLAVPPREVHANSTTFGISGARKVLHAFQIPETGVLKYLQVTLTQYIVGGTLQVRIETINPTSNLPSGNLAYPNATGSLTVTGNGGKYVPINGGTGVSVTKGDEVVLVWSTSDGLAVNMDAYDGYTIPGAQGTSQFPYAGLYATTSWNIQAQVPTVCLEYDGFLKIPLGCESGKTTTSVNINGTSMYGNAFYAPTNCTVAGIWTVMQISGQYMRAILYAADGVTVVAQTPDINPNHKPSSSTNLLYTIAFQNEVTLVKGQLYRLVLQNVTSSANAVIYKRIFTDSPRYPIASALAFGLALFSTSSIAGVWTDDNTARYPLGIMLSSIEANVPNSTGNMNGGFA